jgi:hypothetical protein
MTVGSKPRVALVDEDPSAEQTSERRLRSLATSASPTALRPATPHQSLTKGSDQAAEEQLSANERKWTK